jgi:hypothetical protein
MTATKPEPLKLKPVVGKCGNCKRIVDSEKPRARDATIYVIGDKLACSKACAKALGYDE